METLSSLWLDCCCTPRDGNLLPAVERLLETHRVGWPTDVMSAVQRHQPAFVCVEFDYPDQVRLRVIPLLRRNFPTLPLLMLTEYHSEALAVWAYRHRVWDYRVKPVAENVLMQLIATLTELATAAQPNGWLTNSLPRELVAPSGQLRKLLVSDQRTWAAVAYISEHYGEAVKLETVARLCQLSDSEFSRCFHQEHGLSYRRYLLNYRIAMARDFLAEPNASISAVAYAVGFNDLSHFGRMFRRYVGEPATRYQRRLHSGPAPDNENSDNCAE